MSLTYISHSKTSTNPGTSTLSCNKLAILWKNKPSVFLQRYKLYMSLVLSILIYECESWTSTADLERQIQAFVNKCYRGLLGISYRTQNKRRCMTTGQNTRRASGARSFYCQLSSVASYHGLAMSIVMICCRRSCF